MHARENSVKWGELARLRRLLVSVAQLAVQRSAIAADDARNAHHTALSDAELARAGWQEQLMRELDPVLLQAWRFRVSQMTGSVTRADDALEVAEARLSLDRQSWLNAQRQYDLADVHHRNARRAGKRKQEDQTLMDVSDLLCQNSPQSR